MTYVVIERDRFYAFSFRSMTIMDFVFIKEWDKSYTVHKNRMNGKSETQLRWFACQAILDEYKDQYEPS